MIAHADMTGIRPGISKVSNRITASLVLYKTPNTQIRKILECLSKSSLRPHLYIVDHSPIPTIVDCDFRMTYIHAPDNRGYGAGHNIALRETLNSATFHFVFNPDICFDGTALEVLADYMFQHPEVGHVMPRITNPDGSVQYLCKLLPTPSDLLLRRMPLGPLRLLVKTRLEDFELRFTHYDREMDVPYLSGCFMLLRTEALRRVGSFDERFFMYGEDIDLTRRIHAQYRTVFFPGVSVTHEHARASYKNRHALWLHIQNVSRYFQKWGWFIDRERARINRETIRKLSATRSLDCTGV